MSELDSLILEQSLDDQGLLDHSPHETPFTDAGIRWHLLRDGRRDYETKRLDPRDFLIHEGPAHLWACMPGPCPVCRGRPKAKKSYCLKCDRTGSDGRVQFPGLPIDAAPSADYPTQGTSYKPGRLRGGKR